MVHGLFGGVPNTAFPEINRDLRTRHEYAWMGSDEDPQPTADLVQSTHPSFVLD